METERMMGPSAVELREFEPADAGCLLAWVGGPEELLTWSGPAFSWPLDQGQLGAYAAEASRRIWMAVDARTGEAVGHASLKLAADRPGGRLGRVLVAPAARGRGVGAAMLTQVLAQAFGELGLERVELGVFTHNGSAIRLYERLGFTCEAVLRDVEHVNGRGWSAMRMSVHKPVPGSAGQLRT
jgi:RimJ/RimL family protein N-acetyltransferase